MTTAQLARAAGRAPAAVREIVSALEAKGLVSRSAHRRPLLVATPPESAMDSLFSQRARELEDARRSASRLVAEFQALRDSAEPTEIVQLVSGRDAIVEWATKLQRDSREEVLIFDKPPYAAGGGQNFLEMDLLAKGIRYRVIYDRTSLEWPDQIDMLREITEAGEDGRIVDDLPSGLAISDHRLALLPLNQPGPDREPQRILVHPSPVLDCLVGLFEAYWQRATPVTFVGTDLETEQEDAVEISEEDASLLVLLAADMKDEAIGRQLGIARRSVQRRIRRLMDVVGARSRLQLVLHAAREGWV